MKRALIISDLTLRLPILIQELRKEYEVVDLAVTEDDIKEKGETVKYDAVVVLKDTCWNSYHLKVGKKVIHDLYCA